MVGAELLRLTGGPGRGWYPRHRQQPRPASVEHLDHLAHTGLSPSITAPGPWESPRDRDSIDSRKPCTLPPNLTPKFFHRSPREALRRVTSLLIRKGKCLFKFWYCEFSSKFWPYCGFLRYPFDEYGGMIPKECGCTSMTIPRRIWVNRYLLISCLV